MVTGARGSDLVGRYGGEEFLIIFDDADLETASDLAERIRVRVMADPFCEDSVSLWVTTSFGVAQARADDTVESLTSRADQAMYAAKKAGRNRVRTELEVPAAGRSLRSTETQFSSPRSLTAPRVRSRQIRLSLNALSSVDRAGVRHMYRRVCVPGERMEALQHGSHALLRWPGPQPCHRDGL
jgi:hypothetical protein